MYAHSPKKKADTHGKRSQRQLKNYLLDPSRQLRSAWLFVVLCVLYAIGIAWVFLNTLYQQHAFVMTYLDDADAASFLDVFQNPIIVSGLVQAASLSLLFLLSVIVVTVLFTHRVFGPLVPIQRQVAAMQSGDYSKRINLRRKDELKDLAEAINLLASQLDKERDEGKESKIDGDDFEVIVLKEV